MKKFLALVAVFALVAFATPVFAAANPFMDVPMNHWAYDAIGQLAARGVLSGYPNGAYKGNQPMTRYEVASAVARALAVVDMTKASKQDVEMLKKLVVEFKDELDALGVKVDQLDSRVAVLEAGVGGWKISGSFRMDWKWADRVGGTYTADDDQDLLLRTPNNWLQFSKRIDEKVSYTARLRRHQNNTANGSINWSDNFITVKLPWDITAKFGRTDAFTYDKGMEHPTWSNNAASWFWDDRLEGMAFDKPFGMGMFSFMWGHFDDSDDENESTIYGAQLDFNFNEHFSLGLQGLVKDYQLTPVGDVDKVTSVWANLAFNFTPDVALRGLYAFNQVDWNGGTPAGYDDSPNAYKVLLDVSQNALKFTNLWVEYGKLNEYFHTHLNPLRYTAGFDGADGPSKPMHGMTDPNRGTDMKYFYIVAEQKWSDQWATFLRYLDVKYGTSIDGRADHKNWMAGVRYMYTPSLQFELLYDNISFDNEAVWSQKDDHMIRFRTSVSF